LNRRGMISYFSSVPELQVAVLTRRSRSRAHQPRTRVPWQSLVWVLVVGPSSMRPAVRTSPCVGAPLDGMSYLGLDARQRRPRPKISGDPAGYWWPRYSRGIPSCHSHFWNRDAIETLRHLRLSMSGSSGASPTTHRQRSEFQLRDPCSSGICIKSAVQSVAGGQGKFTPVVRAE